MAATRGADVATVLSRGAFGEAPSRVDVAAAHAACVALAEAELQGKDAVLTALRGALIAAVAGHTTASAPSTAAALVVLDTVVPALPAAALTGGAAGAQMDWSAVPMAWRARWGMDKNALGLALDDIDASQ